MVQNSPAQTRIKPVTCLKTQGNLTTPLVTPITPSAANTECTLDDLLVNRKHYRQGSS